MKVSDTEALFVKSDPMVTGAYGAEPHRSIEETWEWVEGRLNATGQRDSLYRVLESKGEWRPHGELLLLALDGGEGAPD